MSAEGLIAALVRALAWPAVLVAILMIFHKQFGTMLERLSHVRIGVGGAEADLDWNQTEAVVRRSLTAARRPPAATVTAQEREMSRGAPQQPATAPGPAPGGSGSDGAPQALVENRWQALSDSLRGVVRPSGSVGADQLARADFDQLMDAALRGGLLDAATVRSLDGMRHLRNLARTNPSLTPRQAQDFAVMADAVSYGMQRDSGSVWPAA